MKLLLLVLLAARVMPVLPTRFDGHQPIGCITGQNVEDHLWYTEAYVNFPEPNPETGNDGVWHKRWLDVTYTKEKGEKSCNRWLDAVHKFVKERYK